MLSEKKNPSTNVHKIIVTIFFAAYYPVKPKKWEHMYILLFCRF